MPTGPLAWVSLEKNDELDRGVAATMYLAFFEIYKGVLKEQGAWFSPNTLPTILHGQSPFILTWQRPEKLRGFWVIWTFISTQSKTTCRTMLDESVHKQNYACATWFLLLFLFHFFNFIIVVIMMSWLWCRDTK